VTEISCHPGYPDTTSDADYNDERELELRALTDPTVTAAVREDRIRLISYRELPS
jgi:predicted glycoside hydrolase/deacetylase ChbG (UPF0249 family)